MRLMKSYNHHLSFVGIQLYSDVSDHHHSSLPITTNCCLHSVDEIDLSNLSNVEPFNNNNNNNSNVFFQDDTPIAERQRQNNNKSFVLVEEDRPIPPVLQSNNVLSCCSNPTSSTNQMQTTLASKCLMDTNLMHFSMSNNDDEMQTEKCRNNDGNRILSQDFVAPTIKLQSHTFNNNNNGAGSF